MPISKAVASSVKTPGFYLLINLLGGPANPGTAALRTLIMAPKSSAGNITANTEVRTCFGPNDVATALGAGTPGHLAAKRFFERFGLGSLDVVAPTASAGAAATGTQTFTGPATENSTIRFRIHGRQIDVPWLSGEAATTFVTRAVATINQFASDLFVTASDAGTGSLLFTVKVNGPWGNDVRLWAGILEGGGGIAVTVNPVACTGGTTEPSFATALSLVSTREYARIVACLSNADAADTSSSSNGERLGIHLTTFQSGAGALLQVGVIGVTGSTSSAKAGAIDRNNSAMQYVLGRVWDDLPAELAGAEAGDALQWISRERANYNRIGHVHNLYGPRDVVTNKLSATEVEDLLSNGVSPLDVDSHTGVTYLVEPITTHSTSSGAPDYRAYHLPDTDAMFSIFRDLRTATPQEFPNASISPDLPAGSDPLPAGVVEIRDVRAFVISRLRSQVRAGVAQGPALDASIANDDLTVGIDDVDPSQVNIFVPLSIIKPLAKFGVVGAKVA
jgi:phage tail sheath gpL-like